MTDATDRQVAAIRARTRSLANPTLAAQAARYFKTGPGEYGEGDRFLGIRVPALRELARELRATPVTTALALLRSPMHEERLLALLVLVDAFPCADARHRERIYAGYRRAIRRFVNNWDLVDTSAPGIVGRHLEHRERAPLHELAGSPNLWERRVAILATLGFIRRDDFADTLALSVRLLADEHDLIHKAVGWMLREVGNRDRAAAARFLDLHADRMPRTMLRYAIEKLPPEARSAYLKIARPSRAVAPTARRRPARA